MPMMVLLRAGLLALAATTTLAVDLDGRPVTQLAPAGSRAVILFFVALFFVFSDYFGFGGTTTSIGMFLMFVLFLVSAMLWTSSAKKKTVADAERALEGHSFVSLNAPLLNAGLQFGRKVGWRRALPALLALFAASGLAAEWSRHRQQHDDRAY